MPLELLQVSKEAFGFFVVRVTPNSFRNMPSSNFQVTEIQISAASEQESSYVCSLCFQHLAGQQDNTCKPQPEISVLRVLELDYSVQYIKISNPKGR